jgi:RNA polymerase sigma-70 factor (ECF subfamily)
VAPAAARSTAVISRERSGKRVDDRNASSERFRELVLTHLDSAFNLACWLTHSRQDAEDIVQESCLRAFKFFAGFHGGDARAWLLAIVRNTFYSWHGAQRERQQSVEFDEESLLEADIAFAATADNDPEALLMRKDEQRLLQQALARLPLEYREVIVLRELEDLSYRQIAGIAGIPIGTVMSRLGRGRKLMAALLERAAEKK